MRFHDPWVLAVLAAIVPLGIWALVRRAPWREPAFTYGNIATLKGIERGPAARLRALPAWLLVFAAAAFIVGLARPQLPDAAGPTFTEGIDIVLALDVSTSMNALDFQPRDRVTVAKQVVGEFVASRPNDRIGLVVFAGEAYTQCPLTLDHKVIHNLLNDIKTGVIEDGTAIGNAIGTSLNRLRDSKAKSRVVILITDGDNNRGNISPDQSADFAKELGVKVFTIQVGKGGLVPYPTDMKDIFGRQVVRNVEIPVNPELLQRLARTTGAQYYVATDRQSLKGSFQKILDDLLRSRIEESPLTESYVELAGYPIGAGLVAGLLALLLMLTRFSGVP